MLSTMAIQRPPLERFFFSGGVVTRDEATVPLPFPLAGGAIGAGRITFCCVTSFAIFCCCCRGNAQAKHTTSRSL